jgi:hypothetical protein
MQISRAAAAFVAAVVKVVDMTYSFEQLKEFHATGLSVRKWVP